MEETEDSIALFIPAPGNQTRYPSLTFSLFGPKFYVVRAQYVVSCYPSQCEHFDSVSAGRRPSNKPTQPPKVLLQAVVGKFHDDGGRGVLP